MTSVAANTKMFSCFCWRQVFSFDPAHPLRSREKYNSRISLHSRLRLAIYAAGNATPHLPCMIPSVIESLFSVLFFVIQLESTILTFLDASTHRKYPPHVILEEMKFIHFFLFWSLASSRVAPKESNREKKRVESARRRKLVYVFFWAERLGDLYQYWSVLLPDETAQTFALREKIKKKKEVRLNWILETAATWSRMK